MPTNKLRSQAARLLVQALKLHEAGRNAEAHELTVQAANYLEDAVSVEVFRLAVDGKSSSRPKAAKPTPPSPKYLSQRHGRRRSGGASVKL